MSTTPRENADNKGERTADTPRGSDPAVSSVRTGAADKATAVVREANDGDPAFTSYKQRGGEMTAEEYSAVAMKRMDQGDFGTAMREIMSLDMGMPDNAMVEAAAKIIGALRGKNPNADNPMWVVAETYIYLNRM